VPRECNGELGEHGHEAVAFREKLAVEVGEVVLGGHPGTLGRSEGDASVFP
jgi:hypothetical protein